MRRVLLLCTGNSCRSQMAEAILRRLGGEDYEVYSAGTHPAAEVHPLAREVLRDAGYNTAAESEHGVGSLLQPGTDRTIMNG